MKGYVDMKNKKLLFYTCAEFLWFFLIEFMVVHFTLNMKNLYVRVLLVIYGVYGIYVFLKRLANLLYLKTNKISTVNDVSEKELEEICMDKGIFKIPIYQEMIERNIQDNILKIVAKSSKREIDNSTLELIVYVVLIVITDIEYASLFFLPIALRLIYDMILSREEERYLKIINNKIERSNI